MVRWERAQGRREPLAANSLDLPTALARSSNNRFWNEYSNWPARTWIERHYGIAIGFVTGQWFLIFLDSCSRSSAIVDQSFLKWIFQLANYFGFFLQSCLIPISNLPGQARGLECGALVIRNAIYIWPVTFGQCEWDSVKSSKQKTFF